MSNAGNNSSTNKAYNYIKKLQMCWYYGFVHIIFLSYLYIKMDNILTYSINTSLQFLYTLIETWYIMDIGDWKTIGAENGGETCLFVMFKSTRRNW